MGYPAKKPMPIRQPDPVEQIIRRICAMANVSYEKVIGKTSTQEVVMVRFIISQYLKETMLITWAEIGRELNKNHATIIHYVKQYYNFKSTKDRVFMKLLDKVRL